MTTLSNAKVGDIVIIDEILVRRIIAADKSKITILVSPEDNDGETESWSRKTCLPIGEKETRTIRIITMQEAINLLK